jgi:hypothetical protein
MEPSNNRQRLIVTQEQYQRGYAVPGMLSSRGPNTRIPVHFKPFVLIARRPDGTYLVEPPEVTEARLQGGQ